MAPLLHAGIALSVLSTLVHGQFVSAPTDLTNTTGYYDLPVRYKKVPNGICELTPGVKSYSGYVDIEDHQSIFWWFFESRNQDPKEAPLTVWINGGPGSSSMIGLFQELGPCTIDADGKVVNNPYAWNNVSNMLFIDHPAQVGFSYSEPIPGYISQWDGSIIQLPDDNCPKSASGCATYSLPSAAYTVNSTQNAAPSMWKTLQGFMGAFPKYSRSGFHFATESYGGHYGPVFNEYIVTQNALIDAGKLSGAHKIELESVLIGNGWYDPLLGYEGYYNFSVDPGNTYDIVFPNEKSKKEMYDNMYGEGNCYDQTIMCQTTKRDDVCAAADSFCYYNVEYLFDAYLGRDEYDSRELNPDRFPYNYYVEYLNTPKVQEALGAFVNFSDFSNTVGNAFSNTGDDDRIQGSIKDCRKLVNQGVYMVQFNGDADYTCNWLGNQAAAMAVKAPGMTSAGFENISTSDSIIHGVSKQSDNFAFVRIYESGHEVPFYQPVVALEMFERVINGYDVATGKTKVAKGKGFKTSGPSESLYREGNSTVQFSVLPKSATYNTTTNQPNPYKNNTARSLFGAREHKKKHWRPRPGLAREYMADFGRM